MSVIPPQLNPTVWQQLLAGILDQVAKYGLATILAISLVALLVWERIEIDRSSSIMLGRLIENQAIIIRNQEKIIATQDSLVRLVERLDRR